MSRSRLVRLVLLACLVLIAAFLARCGVPWGLWDGPI
jgi:hypothetical protein